MGEMNDFDAFYRENLRLIYALALAKGGAPDQAEDLVQETFCRALRHFDKLAGQSQGAQRAWLVRVLNNLHIDQWRRSAANDTDLSADLPGRTEPERGVLLRLDVARALIGLEEENRRIVLLYYYLEMNSREIGELLEMPEGTVRYRLSQCRGYLAERLSAWNTQ